MRKDPILLLFLCLFLIAGAMAAEAAQVYTADEVDSMMANLSDSMDSRLSAVDDRLDAMDKRLDGIDGRLDALQKECDVSDGNVSDLRQSIASLRYEVDSAEKNLGTDGTAATVSKDPASGDDASGTDSPQRTASDSSVAGDASDSSGIAGITGSFLGSLPHPSKAIALIVSAFVILMLFGFYHSLRK